MASLRDALLEVLIGNNFRDFSERRQNIRILVAGVLIVFLTVTPLVLSLVSTEDIGWREWLLFVPLSLVYTAALVRFSSHRSMRRDAGEERRLRGLQDRLESSEDSDLRDIVAEYAEDEVATLFDDASRRQEVGGWIAIALGIAALIAAAAVAWALIINSESTQTTADALARLAITVPAVYAAGVLFKRGGVMQDHGTRLKAAGVAIRAIPLIAGRITDDDLRSEFLRDAYLAQLTGATPKDSKQTEAADNLVARLLK